MILQELIQDNYGQKNKRPLIQWVKKGGLRKDSRRRYFHGNVLSWRRPEKFGKELEKRASVQGKDRHFKETSRTRKNSKNRMGKKQRRRKKKVSRDAYYEKRRET